jgi:hypothetical protein
VGQHEPLVQGLASLTAPMLLNNSHASNGNDSRNTFLAANNICPNICPINLEFDATPAPAVLGTSWLRLRGYGSDDEDEDDDDDEDGLGILTKGKDKAKEAAKKRKKRSNQPKHPDLERIAVATMETLKELNIDPSSKEGQKIKRRVRNRMSAQLHRERKKAYIGYLEGLVREKEKNLGGLTKNLEKLYNDYNSLRQSLVDITDNTGSLDKRAVQLLTKFPAYVAVPPASKAASETADYTSASNSTPPHNPSDSERSYSLTSNDQEFTFDMNEQDDFDDDEAWGGAPKKMKGSVGQSVSLFSVVFLLSAFSLFGKNTLTSSLFPTFSSPAHTHLAPVPTISVLESRDAAVPDWPQFSTAALPTVQNRLVVAGAEDNDSIARLVVDHRASREEPTPVIPAENHHYPIVPSSIFSVATTPSSSASANLYEDATIPGHGADASSSRYVLSPEHALWKYQDNVIPLFPNTGKYSVLSNPQVNKNVLHKRRYLRSHKLLDDGDNSTQEARRYVVNSIPRLPMSESTTNNGSKSSVLLPSAMSHVVMTQGRALLDVNLASELISARTAAHQRQSQASAAAAHESTDTSKALSTWVSPATTTANAAGGAAAPAVVNPPPAVTTVVPVAMTLPTSGINTEMKDPASNVLLMLMPASSVRWGKSWADSASMASLFTGMNADGTFQTDNATNNGFYGEGEAVDPSNVWIEIGCQVIRAQVVKNVTFTS